MRWLLVCLALAGCGDDAMFGGKKDKGGGDEGDGAPEAAADSAPPRSQYFATAAAMPACTAENQDWLVYVADEKKLKACLAGTWTDVETAGNPNPFTPELQYSCGMSADLDGDPDAQTTGVSTLVTKFTNGDWAITCMDRYYTTEFFYADSTSSQAFFRSESAGVQGGIISCLGFYAMVTYSIKGNVATWADNAGNSTDITLCEALQ